MFPDNGNKWFKIVPKNVDLFACHLGNDALDYLWKCIDAAKKDKRNVNEIVSVSYTHLTLPTKA